jgi:hypothetical protein
MALLALVLGAAMVRWGQWLSTWMLHVALASVQVVIGIAFVAVGDPSCAIRVFFLWATPYAALHFSVRAALAHLCWTSTVFVTSLTLMPAETHRTLGDRPAAARDPGRDGGARCDRRHRAAPRRGGVSGTRQRTTRSPDSRTGGACSTCCATTASTAPTGAVERWSCSTWTASRR